MATTVPRTKLHPAYLPLAGLIFVLIATAIFFDPYFARNRDYTTRQSAERQTVRSIAVMLFTYAGHHGGNFPDGANSTEVFQKLIDEKYCTDPRDFYIRMPGKTEPSPGEKLKPENVCFDLTGGVTKSDSPWLPLVFITGARVNYTPGSTAAIRQKDMSNFENTAWLWTLRPPQDAVMVVFYLGHTEKLFLVSDLITSNGIITDFVPPKFDAKGKTYRQLTPSGELP